MRWDRRGGVVMDTATLEILTACRRRGVSLIPDGANLRFKAPAGAIDEPFKLALSAAKRELLAYLDGSPLISDEPEGPPRPAGPTSRLEFLPVAVPVDDQADDRAGGPIPWDDRYVVAPSELVAGVDCEPRPPEALPGWHALELRAWLAELLDSGDVRDGCGPESEQRGRALLSTDHRKALLRARHVEYEAEILDLIRRANAHRLRRRAESAGVPYPPPRFAPRSVPDHGPSRP